VWLPSRGVASPVATFQEQILPDVSPEKKVCLSSETATDMTGLECPFIFIIYLFFIFWKKKLFEKKKKKYFDNTNWFRWTVSVKVVEVT